MSGEQSKDAAERSAHVLRGDAPARAEGLHPVKEWKTPEGKTMGQLRVVAELQERVRVLEEALAGACEMLDKVDHADHDAEEREMKRLWDADVASIRAALARGENGA